MNRRPTIAIVLALSLATAACGGDDDSSPTPTTGATATDTNGDQPTSDAGTAAPDDPNGERALGSEASGTVVMTVGDTTVEADIVSCTVVAPEVTFIAQGETAAIEVGSQGGDAVSVTVTGAYEFTGTGAASVDSEIGIDQGNVRITGSGAQPDDEAPIEDFTIQAQITAC